MLGMEGGKCVCVEEKREGSKPSRVSIAQVLYYVLRVIQKHAQPVDEENLIKRSDSVLRAEKGEMESSRLKGRVVWLYYLDRDLLAFRLLADKCK